MARNKTYNMVNLKSLADEFNHLGEESTKMLSNALNESLPTIQNEAVRYISDESNLQDNYVNSKFNVYKRSSRNNLSIVFGTSTVDVLLNRYPNVEAPKTGFKVAINKGSPMKLIRGSFNVPLRGTGGKQGIAVNAKRAMRMTGSFNAKGRAYVSRLNARTKGRGLVVLRSKSITQMFYSARDSIMPDAIFEIRKRFMEKVNL